MDSFLRNHRFLRPLAAGADHPSGPEVGPLEELGELPEELGGRPEDDDAGEVCRSRRHAGLCLKRVIIVL